jgi:hypothetical protein
VFGEVAYFTEVPQMESVVSLSVCRILAIPRASYESLCQDFPIGSRTVLENLKRQAQQVSLFFFSFTTVLENLKRQAKQVSPFFFHCAGKPQASVPTGLPPFCFPFSLISFDFSPLWYSFSTRRSPFSVLRFPFLRALLSVFQSWFSVFHSSDPVPGFVVEAYMRKIPFQRFSCAPFTKSFC